MRAGRLESRVGRPGPRRARLSRGRRRPGPPPRDARCGTWTWRSRATPPDSRRPSPRALGAPSRPSTNDSARRRWSCPAAARGRRGDAARDLRAPRRAARRCRSGASLAEDLARRDFSIHAMALDVSRRPPALLDPCGGARDLAGAAPSLPPSGLAGRRSRRGRSAPCDTRTAWGSRSRPRRARGRSRRRSRRERSTRVSGDRLRRELVLIFAEPRRARAVRFCCGSASIAPSLPGLARSARGRRGARARRRRPRREPSGPRLALLPSRLDGSGADVARSGSSPTASPCRGGRALAVEPLAGDPPASRAGLRAARARRGGAADRGSLRGGDPRGGGAALGRRPPRARDARREAAASQLSISGADLVARGVAPGPAIGRALAATRAAREDGRIGPGREELAFALARARRRAGARESGARAGRGSRRRVAPTPGAHARSGPDVLRGVGPAVERGLRPAHGLSRRNPRLEDEPRRKGRGQAGDALRRVELQFYCDFFARAELWAIPKDRRTGLTGPARLLLGRHARAAERRPDHAALRRVLDGHGRELLAAVGARGTEGPLPVAASAGHPIPPGPARSGHAPETLRRRRLPGPPPREGERLRRDRRRERALLAVRQDRGAALPVLAARGAAVRVRRLAGAAGRAHPGGQMEGEEARGARRRRGRPRAGPGPRSSTSWARTASRAPGSSISSPGSGAVGLEAVSRGAASAVLVDSDGERARPDLRAALGASGGSSARGGRGRGRGRRARPRRASGSSSFSPTLRTACRAATLDRAIAASAGLLAERRRPGRAGRRGRGECPPRRACRPFRGAPTAVTSSISSGSFDGRPGEMLAFAVSAGDPLQSF